MKFLKTGILALVLIMLTVVIVTAAVVGGGIAVTRTAVYRTLLVGVTVCFVCGYA